MIYQILFVGLGGAAGSIVRYATSLLANKLYAGPFPLGTFLVNSLGCFLIGLFTGWTGQLGFLPTETRWLLITGFCGGYTTFSAFAIENVRLLQTDQLGLALANIALSIIGGTVAVWAGLWASKAV